jgi:hypothetical protein
MEENASVEASTCPVEFPIILWSSKFHFDVLKFPQAFSHVSVDIPPEFKAFILLENFEHFMLIALFKIAYH